MNVPVLMLYFHRVHMPEEFIWQAFDDFADVYNHMTKFRLSSLGLADHRDRHYVLHLDIKPDNGMQCCRGHCLILADRSPSSPRGGPHHQRQI